MSALPEIDYASMTNHQADQAEAPAAEPEAPDEPISPTTSIYKVLLTIGLAFVLGLVLNARSIVHDAAGMPDGRFRDLTAFVGGKALTVADATHLSWPRDQIDAALGNQAQPEIPPLLQVGTFTTPGPANTPPAEAPTSAVRVIAQISTPTPVPPTATAIPPSATPVPPTATPLPPSPTPKPTIAFCRRGNGYVPCTGRKGPRATAPCHVGGRTRGCPSPRPRPTHTPVPPTSTPTNTPIPPTPTLTPTATATLAPPPRVVSSALPLRLLVTGDSLTGYLGPESINKSITVGPTHGIVATHNGTGLTRPDFLDWSLVAQAQVKLYNPDAVVVMIGGNDFQNMTLPNGSFFTAGTPAWTAEYERRAAICMRIWAQGGKTRVYWISMPPARNSDWAKDDRQINIALAAAAAQVPGAEFLNVLGPLTDHGKYVDFIRWHGAWLLIREPDGVHLNPAGSTIVAGEVLDIIQREWRLKY